MANDQDLAGLPELPPEEVMRAAALVSQWMAANNIKDWALDGCASREWQERLARENAELLHLPDRIHELRKAEAELAALKRKIAEAVTADITVWYDGDEEHVELTSLTGIPDDLDDERVALLPVGGEG